MPSFGTVGDGLDNAMMESFWSSMQIELLNRKRWKTRVELSNAMFDYIEIFYNRQRFSPNRPRTQRSTRRYRNVCNGSTKMAVNDPNHQHF
jgi:transposase InsO family protein